MAYSREPVNSLDSRTKRQQILDAAYVVFSRKGYHRATVDEIIALADTGKGTVYNYFVNKEQLFYTLIKERSASFEVSLADIVQSDKPSLVKVEAMIKVFLQFYVSNGDLWRVMMHEVRGLGTEGNSCFTQEQRDKYRQWFTQTIGMLEKVLQAGIDQGVIRKCDANKVAHGLFSVVIITVFQKFVDDDIDVTAHMITDIFLHGVARS